MPISKLTTFSRRPVWFAATTLALALAFLGVFDFSSKDGAAQETVAPSEPLAADTFRPTPRQWEDLRIAPVEGFRFRTELFTEGMIATNENTTANVFSPFSGRVSNLVAKIGDNVQKGDPLMAVEASEFVQGHNDLISALSHVSSARAQLALARKTEERERELHRAKAGALKDWLESQTNLRVAQSDLRTAEIALNAARNQLRILGKTEAEIKELERARQSSVANTEAVVKAPISGTVVDRKVGFGQYLQSAAEGATDVLFSIADLSTVWLVAHVRETEVGAIRVGQPVKARVLAHPDRTFEAKVTWVSPTVDMATYRVPVRAEIDNHEGLLKPMMFANFRIQTGEPAIAPAVPKNAIIRDGNVTRVYVARADGTVQARDVTLGKVTDEMVEIIDGVDIGENVVTAGALFMDRAIQGN